MSNIENQGCCKKLGVWMEIYKVEHQKVANLELTRDYSLWCFEIDNNKVFNKRKNTQNHKKIDAIRRPPI